MSCPFRKEPLFMSSRRMMMVGMRELWMEWLGFFLGITWSLSCIILSKAQQGCLPHRNSQVFPDYRKALGIPLQWNEWRIQMTKATFFFFGLSLSIKTKKQAEFEQMDLSAITYTMLSCLDWNKVTVSEYIRGITALEKVNVLGRLIQKKNLGSFSGILYTLGISPPAESVALDDLQCPC